MKKLLIIEAVVLAVLVIAAIVFTIIPKPVVPDPTDTSTQSSQNTTDTATVDPSQDTTEDTTDNSTQDSTGDTTQDTAQDATEDSTQNTTGESTGGSMFVPTWKTYPDNRQLLAKQYFIYDCNANSFVQISGQQDEKIYPASITKLFTAYIVLQRLSPDTQITAGDVLDMIHWDSSVAQIQKGDVLTVRELIAGMLLPSGNDAAYMLACEAGKVIANNSSLSNAGAIQVFVNQMNTQAAQVGMTNSHFMNPDGIHDDNHYTSPADLVTLGKLVMENALIMEYAQTAKQELPLHGQSIQWKNSNSLIDPSSPYYCPYAIGLKTGKTTSAGNCLLSAFEKDGRKLLIGVFGCPEAGDRFDDTLHLFNQIVLD